MELPAWFERFMSPDADRSAELVGALDEQGIAHGVVELAEGRFILVWPPNVVRDKHYRTKIVTAHHDRVRGTPGALDNSAACLQLVSFLCSARETFNTLVVFTDREELGPGSSTTIQPLATASVPSDQGSYALGKAFGGKLGESLGLTMPMAFPLDVTGHGDALVLSRAAEGLCRCGEGEDSARGSLPVMVAETGAMALEVSRMMSARAPVYMATVPFGEDLGFMLAGIPALTITIMPRNEAQALANMGGLPPWAALSAPGGRMPQTWKTLHGPDDTVALYTADAFRVADRLLTRLASLRMPVSVGWRD